MTSRTSDSTSLSGERACTLTALAIADLVRGELRGAPDTTIDSVAPLERASANQLTFLSIRRYASELQTSRAGIVLVNPDLADSPGAVPSRIVVANPLAALLDVLPLLYSQPRHEPAIHPTACIGRGARIGAGVSLDEYAVIGDGAVLGDDVWVGAHSVVGPGVTIGRSSQLLPHVTLYGGAELGERVVIHSGARIASDGFGYVLRESVHAKIPHVGRCIIGDDVEIGANTTIDRGSIDDTEIGAGTKIDNLVQIGHNVHIGRLCLIMAQVGVAGSVRIGDGCVIAGQAGLANHVTIGAGVRLAAQSGVFGDVPAGESWSGYPARPHRESLRASGALFKLAGMMKRIEKLLDERDRG